MEHLVELKNIKKYFVTGYKDFFRRKPVYLKAVDDVSIEINRGETLGLVGESGCGKSTLARVMSRLDEPTSGDIFFDKINLTELPSSEMVKFRKYFQMIFQDPYSSLNPRLTVGEIVAEPLIIYNNYGLLKQDRAKIKERVKYLLDIVGLSFRHINRYPHEFSGGQRQRIGIARSLALQPKLILCDEPVSALDVSIQSQILNLLNELQDEFSLTYLFISHDLSVVKHISDRVAVMYLGRIIELADYKAIYRDPLHPYTKALLSSIPIPDPVKAGKQKKIYLQGDLSYPERSDMCRFYNRCYKRKPECLEIDPSLKEVKSGHFAACILY